MQRMDMQQKGKEVTPYMHAVSHKKHNNKLLCKRK